MGSDRKAVGNPLVSGAEEDGGEGGGAGGGEQEAAQGHARLQGENQAHQVQTKQRVE